ncbi:hypothetical protein SmJEL517_g04377 [Synchytrium microbalum]|uniref:Rab-GAP TBC domain-containing protein n=1 Tax=Synchytrium microbalum TaxID=1806994 RepID=A0A507C557_9FUNG|nr:uncharacterized protein SmJEL517_g04377 [Synchytrium microbalum]TPX32565.1 hypothetical protein SmJEL517_g04377 [Synchytrium microbalum]
MSVRLLCVNGNVTIRPNNLEPLVGFLTLLQDIQADTTVISWLPADALNAVEREIYKKIDTRTRVSPEASARSDGVALVTSPLSLFSSLDHLIYVPIPSLKGFYVEGEFTVNSKGGAVLITRVEVALVGGEDSDIPAFWFDSEDGIRPPNPEAVVKLLNGWMAAIDLQLVQSSDTPNLYATKPLGERQAAIPLPYRAPELRNRQGRVNASNSTTSGSSSSSGGLVVPFSGDQPARAPSPNTDRALRSLAVGLGNLGLSVVRDVAGAGAANRVQEAGWGILERFSKVSQFGKARAGELISHPQFAPLLPLVPPNIRQSILSSRETSTMIEEYQNAGDYLAKVASEFRRDVLGVSPSNAPRLKGPIDTSCDYENLAIGLSHGREELAVSADRWLLLYDNTGRLLIDPMTLREMIYNAGLEDDVRPVVWMYMLGVYPWASTEKERNEIMELKRAEYEAMKREWTIILNDVDKEDVANGVPPGQINSNAQAGDEREDGDVLSKLKERRYRIEKDVVRTDRTEAFFQEPKSPSSPVSADGEEGAVPSGSQSPPALSPTALRKTHAGDKNANLLLLRDVLITYTVYNFELGYVQGMNDLLAPILAVTRDEVQAFCCFAGFMNRGVQFNFYRDQSGMRAQLRRLELLLKFIDPYLYHHLVDTDSINLFCCFRWILVWFKREFDFGDTFRLWETIWACPYTKHYHLIVAFAIINEHRRSLITSCKAFDETLKYINDLSGKIPVEPTLERAAVLWQVFFHKMSIVMMDRLGIDVHSNSKVSPLSPDNTLDVNASSSQQAAGGYGTWGPTQHPNSPPKQTAPVGPGKARMLSKPVNKEDELSDEELFELMSLLETEGSRLP